MIAYSCRQIIHQGTVKDGPATVKVTNALDQSAINGNKGTLRINICHDRSNEGIVDVREVTGEDRNHGPYIIQMNPHVHCKKSFINIRHIFGISVESL